MDKIYKLSKTIDFNNLTYYCKSPDLAPVNFISFRGPLHIYENIKIGDISTEKAKENQKQFKLKLSEIITENPNTKSKGQLNAIENIKYLYESSEEIIELYNDYAKIKSEAMHKAKNGTGLKILAPKQMFQRLPIALAQVKA